MAKRDEFDLETKELLAKRVGMRCSNPNCRQPTSGPQENPRKVLNIGVAAHITGASKHGPRYDADLTPSERRSPDNGIWLCQNHGKLVDNDPRRYTAEMLREWKRLSEQAALMDIEGCPPSRRTPHGDAELLRFFVQCFDRPAFQDPFMQEGSMEAFDKAIEDTITAINTGCLRSRDGAVLSRAKGKAFLRNAIWRSKMDTVTDLLRAIRSRYALAIRSGQIHVSQRSDERQYYCIHNPEIAAWMDATRAEALGIMGEICEETGIPAPVFPRSIGHRRHRWSNP